MTYFRHLGHVSQNPNVPWTSQMIAVGTRTSKNLRWCDFFKQILWHPIPSFGSVARKGSARWLDVSAWGRWVYFCQTHELLVSFSGLSIENIWKYKWLPANKKGTNFPLGFQGPKCWLRLCQTPRKNFSASTSCCLIWRFKTGKPAFFHTFCCPFCNDLKDDKTRQCIEANVASLLFDLLLDCKKKWSDIFQQIYGKT